MKTKKIISLIMALSISASCAMSAGAQHATLGDWGSEYQNYTSVSVANFKDVPTNYWAYGAIDRVIAKGWMKGYPDGTFHPDASITRAEAMTVFMEFLGIQPRAISSVSYSDISVYDWYAPYIEAGKDLFPAKATFNGQNPFLPNQPITREDVCYALVKAKKFESQTTFANQAVLNMFVDSYSISTSIKPYVAVAVNNNLVSGYPDGSFGAQDPLTRAEFATMLYRASFAGTQQ